MHSFARNRFGIPGVIAVVALVFAMAGGAWAAKKYVITSTSQIKPSVLKALKGEAGTAGTKGDTGAPGSPGAIGSKGAPGANGAPGADGAPGAEGPAGPEGVCSSAGCELPSGVTETGAWTIGAVAEGSLPKGVSEPTTGPISFAVPLSAPLDEGHVHYIPEGGPATTECPGSAADPEAVAGHLCVYVGRQTAAGWLLPAFEIKKPSSESGANGADTAGAFLLNLAIAKGAIARGTWAVTAP